MSSIYSSKLLVSGSSPLSPRRVFAGALESQAKKGITSEITFISYYWWSVVQKELRWSLSVVFDNASYFSSIILTTFANERGIKMHYSANYYPQGNGLEKSTKKNIIRILKKTVIENQRN